MTLRCAVLDDYQGAALTFADWSPLAGQVEVHAVREHLADRDQLVAALAGCEIVVGLGKIGSRVARVATAFGMRVLAWSEHLTEERAAAEDAERAASKEDLLRRSDFVSIHLVLSERTRALLGEAELSVMPPHAYLINTSRAGIVDQAALLRALREGWIAGAGLDVFDIEPLPAGHPLRTLPTVLATPHLGYVTEGNYRTYYTQAVEDISAFLAGSPVRLLPAG